MKSQELAHLRDYLHAQGIMFCFSGYMTEEVLAGIGDALKRKLQVEAVDTRTMRGLFSIFVELVQNVIRYSAESATPEQTDDVMDLRYGVLTVGRADGGYFIACGNVVQQADADRLVDNLAHLKSLSPDELKALYRQTLRDDPPKGSKGAGVGFIEIARRAHIFDYDFHPVSPDRTFFSLRATI